MRRSVLVLAIAALTLSVAGAPRAAGVTVPFAVRTVRSDCFSSLGERGWIVRKTGFRADTRRGLACLPHCLEGQAAVPLREPAARAIRQQGVMRVIRFRQIQQAL